MYNTINQGNFMLLNHIIYFIYGLTFFSLGLVLLVETWRLPPEAVQLRLVRPLVVFGLLHGLHEWFENYYLMVASIPEIVRWVRLLLLAGSFLALSVYCFQVFQYAREHLSPFTIFGLITLPVYIILILLDISLAIGQDRISFYQFLENGIRYILGVPTAALGTLGLHAAAQKARADKRIPLNAYLDAAAAGMGIYSLTQIFVPKTDTLLGNLLNTANFLAFTGVPIQLVRTLAGILLTISLFLVTHFLENERRQLVVATQQAHMEALKEKENLRRELLRHIVQAQEDERGRISRELHDETAQVLSAFSLELASLRNLADKKPMVEIVDRLQELSKNMTQGLYRMVHDLRPAQLDDLGLVPALKFMMERDCCPHGIQIDFNVHGQEKRLDPLVETVLFRVAQEGLNNIVRHAETDQARITLEYAQEAVKLKITDAGVGFDPNEPVKSPGGWGLIGMRERVESVGGSFNIQAQKGEGTRIEAVIPLVKTGVVNGKH
ncbi:MAG: hypothetical protein Kow002_17260 [Anaerolineales bacterium]